MEIVCKITRADETYPSDGARDCVSRRDDYGAFDRITGLNTTNLRHETPRARVRNANFTAIVRRTRRNVNTTKTNTRVYVFTRRQSAEIGFSKRDRFPSVINIRMTARRIEIQGRASAIYDRQIRNRSKDTRTFSRLKLPKTRKKPRYSRRTIRRQAFCWSSRTITINTRVHGVLLLPYGQRSVDNNICTREFVRAAFPNNKAPARVINAYKHFFQIRKSGPDVQ